MTPAQLDPSVRRELRPLSAEVAERVARHLVMTGRLVDDDPGEALAHARAARRVGGRIAAVREAAGIAAYRAGEYGEALSELRAARRMTGSEEHLPLVADCERGLGRPERALQLAAGPAATQLSRAGRVELAIVAAGARLDLGQPAAAVVALQSPDLHDEDLHPWTARLWYAFADALLAAGRRQEAATWFLATSTVDGDGLTDAEQRLLDLGPTEGGPTPEDGFDPGRAER